MTARSFSHSGIRLAPAGFNFHSGILKERSDIACVIHTHQDAGVVVSTLSEPLMIFDQGGCRLNDEVGYHAFEGLANQQDEVPRILRDLGHRHTLIMQNHGLLSVGASIGEAFGWMRALIDACAVQERVLATGRPYRTIPDDLQKRAKAQMGGNNRGAPREDHSWQYFLRLAERLDPAFAA
jgi:ribulose-5-phosphate 4-epimerase/fuculose-1-phosphate aldolase